MKWRKLLINHALEVNSVKFRWRKINIIHLEKETLYFFKTVQLKRCRDVAVYFNNSYKALRYIQLTTVMKAVNVMINSRTKIQSLQAQNKTIFKTKLMPHKSSHLNRLRLEFAIRYIQSTLLKIQKNVT